MTRRYVAGTYLDGFGCDFSRWLAGTQESDEPEGAGRTAVAAWTASEL